MSDCRICHLPLSAGELSLNRTWHFDCQRCTFCNESLPAPDLIEKQLDAGLAVGHDTCRKTKAFQDFKAKKLPLSLEMLTALNDELVSFFPAVNPDSSDIDLLYKLMLRMQEITVNVNWVLNLTKDKVRIRESQSYNNQLEEKTRQVKEAKRAEQVETLARQEKQEQLAKERENPKLRNRRKAVEGFVAMGFTREQAEQMVPQIKAEGDTTVQ